MFAEIKRLTAHTSVYGITNILARSLSFILLPIHTRILTTPAEYGIAVIIFAFIGFVNVMYMHGIDTAFLRFYVLKEKGFTHQNVFSTAFFSVLGISTLLSIGILLFSDYFSVLCFESPEYSHIIKYTAGILFFDALAVLPFLTMRAEERSLTFMLLKLINISMTTGLNLYFVMQRGVEGIFIANLISSAATFLLVSPIIIKKLTFDLSSTVYKEIMSFGLPYIIPGISIISMELIDRFFIERILGESVAGVYGAGYKLAMAMSIAVAAFRFAWHPFFLSIANKKNARNIYARVLTYFVATSGWIYLIIVYFIYDIISFEIPFIGGYLIKQDYWDGIAIVPVCMLAYIFYGIYTNFVVGIYIKKKSVFLAGITGFSALLNMALNFYLVPIYGMMGAATAKVVSYAYMAFLLLVVTQKIYSIQYEYKRIIHCALICAAFFFLFDKVLQNTHIFIRIIVITAYPFMLYSTRYFNVDEKNALKHKIRTFLS